MKIEGVDMDNGLATHTPVMVVAFITSVLANASQAAVPTLVSILFSLLISLLVGVVSAVINAAVRPVVETWIAERRAARLRAQDAEQKELPPAG